MHHKKVFEVRSDPKYSWVELIDEEKSALIEQVSEYQVTLPWAEIQIAVMKKDNPHRNPYKILSDCPTPNFFSPIIISQLAREIIESHASGLQFLPVKIGSSDYYFLNSQICLPALDRNSEIEYFDADMKRICHIRKYAFRHEIIEHHALFTIEGYRGHYFVSEALKRALEEKCKGFIFIDTSLYQKSFMTFANR